LSSNTSDEKDQYLINKDHQ